MLRESVLELCWDDDVCFSFLVTRLVLGTSGDSSGDLASANFRGALAG